LKTKEQGGHFYASVRSILLASCRCGALRLLGICLVGSIGCFNLHADDVTFLDASATLSVSTSSSRISGSCTSTPEQCTATILAPQGATLSGTTLFPPVFIGELNGVISDDLEFAICHTDVCGQEEAFVTFRSDDDSGAGLFGGQTCADFSNTCITENGSVQQGGTISWDNGTVDTVFFQSDFERTPEPAVPEPGTLVLFGSGLASIVGLARRRILTRA
jgi:PEP-CTERM motif-containing protein